MPGFDFRHPTLAMADIGSSGGSMSVDEALKRLDPKIDEHWTADGKPAVRAVAELAGNPQISRDEIDQAAGDRSRETWQESGSAGTDTDDTASASTSRSRGGKAASSADVTEEQSRGVASNHASVTNAQRTGGTASVNRNAMADHAEAEANADKGGPDNPNPDVEDPETVNQKKMTLDEALTGGDPTGIDKVGAGSITEEAPAVRGRTLSEESDRIVQQGDEVVVTTRNPINTQLVNRALVSKINQDGSINVRIKLNNGLTQDISGVLNADAGTGAPWFAFPAEDSGLADEAAQD